MTGAILTLLGFSLIGAAVQRFAGGGARFLLGLGTVGLVLYAALLLHMPPLPVLVALVVGSLLTLVFVQKRETSVMEPHRNSVAIFVTVLPVVLLLFATAIIPLADYDGRAFWVLKAKAIAAEEQVDGPYFAGLRGHNPKNEYPLLVPVAAGAVMLAAGDLDDMQIRWIYVLALGSLALHARRWVGDWPAALITWLPQFAIEPQGSAISAYNDIFVAAFAACAFFELIEKSSPARFGIWISFLLLTKNEGLPFALLLLGAALWIWRARVVAALPSFAVALATLLVWRSRVDPTDDDPLLQLLPNIFDRLERLGPAVTLLAQHALDLQRWGLFWFAVAASVVVLVLHRRWRDLVLPVAVIGAMTCVYIAAYMVTNWRLEDHIQTSADRLLMHFIGPAVFLIGVVGRRSAPDLPPRLRGR